jgi:hypothetical protein
VSGERDLVLVPVTLTLLEAGGGGHRGGRMLWHSLLSSLRQPLVWAPVAGLVLAFAGVHLPEAVGLAASLGAGISMGFAEALSDDGSLTGRGRPWTRGLVCGLMTALGGLGHSLPYLIPGFNAATTVAVAVVLAELGAISYIRHHYMDTPLVSAIFQVVVGGVLVFLTGILIGSS